MAFFGGLKKNHYLYTKVDLCLGGNALSGCFEAQTVVQTIDKNAKIERKIIDDDEIFC